MPTKRKDKREAKRAHKQAKQSNETLQRKGVQQPSRPGYSVANKSTGYNNG